MGSKLMKYISGFLSELRLYICNEWVSSVPSHSIRNFFYIKVMKFNMGSGSVVMMHCRFDCTRNFSLGDYSVINQGCRLDNRGGLFIGKNVSVSQEVIILTADHDLESPDFAGRNNAVVVSDYCWLGTRATILPGVHLGTGAVVGSGSVVTKNIPDHIVVGGVPARPIRERPTELTYKLSYRRLFQ